MSFLISIIKGASSFGKTVKKARAVVKKGGKGISAISKATKDTIITFCIAAFFMIAIIGGGLYSVTGAVGEAFNWLKDKMTLNGLTMEELVNSMSEADMKALEDATGAYFNPKKLSGYLKEERESIPSSIPGIEHTNNNGTKTSRQITLDTTSYIDKYKTNWEFIAAIDLAAFEAGDGSKDNVLRHAKGIRSVFSWATDKYSRDETNYSKKWIETREYDPTTGKTTVIKDTKAQAKETFIEVKTPLAIPNTVDTAFGQDVYSVTEDINIVPKVWSSPFVTATNVKTETRKDKQVDDLTKPITEPSQIHIFKGEDGLEYKVSVNENPHLIVGNKNPYKYQGTFVENGTEYYVYKAKRLFGKETLIIPTANILEGKHNQDLKYSSKGVEEIFTGRYEKKWLYKEITITTDNREIIAKEIYEDQVSNIQTKFAPKKFIQFINNSGLSVKDLDLVKEVLVNIPNSNGFIKIIDQIINGGFGNISDGAGNGGGSSSGGANGGSLSGVLPLYMQWDPKWGTQAYAGETIGIAGCAPTTMAMVISGLGGKVSNGMDLNGDNILDPSESAKWATSKGYAAHMQGSYDSIVSGMSNDSGLSATNTRSIDEVYNALKTGKIVVANVVPGTIIKGYHFLALTGVDIEGKITMNDPNSKENSAKSWDKSVIARESQNYWIIDNPNLSGNTKFIMKIRMGAIENYVAYGVFPSITMSQGALESGWGKSDLAVLANNLYGVKAHDSWTGPTIDLPTKEYNADGSSYITTAKWRVFTSWAESTINHGVFLNENPRYRDFGVFNAKDYKEQANSLRNAGYATDPNYPSLLINLIEDFDLQLYDDIAKNMKKN